MAMISVIVPIYNAEKYLEECLNSLVNQTLQDIEFILVNDGSTDSSHSICNKFLSQFDNFKLINKPNNGLMSSWLEGIKYVSGDYIGFVDSDDYVDKTMFEKMYDKAQITHADIIMCDRYDVFTDRILINRLPISPGIYDDDKLDIIRQKILPKVTEHHITNARWNKIYKKDLFLSQIKYCESKSRFFEDRYIIPACMFAANRIVYIDQPLYYYRQRLASNHMFASLKIYNSLKEIMAIQSQVLLSLNLYNKYYPNLIESHLDYLRQLTTRNIVNNKKNKKIRFETLKIIIKDDDFKHAFFTYQLKLTGKQKFLYKIMFKTNSAYLAYIFLIVTDIFHKPQLKKAQTSLWK
jgi:glycosyltransferase involved in cell wall biosynthesis